MLLLRDILESQNDYAFSVVAEKRETHARILAHLLDPLNQSIQLVGSNLHSVLDVSVYMLNCLNAIKSVLIMYQHTDNRLEMIKAQVSTRVQAARCLLRARALTAARALRSRRTRTCS